MTPERELKMIQIQNASQFTNAAARCQKERMLVRVKGFRSYTVTNRTNGRTYEVFFSILNGKRFGACNCAAGYPMNSTRAPKVCKHLYAALGLHIALMSQTSH
jgi:hypothetical protein